MTQPAFHFDASACSGCKACVAACKDKNDLPVGLLWRRVYEVTGGGWMREGQTWTSDVFAYNLSMSCHHCAQPICVEVCPTGAMHKREDGIVAVDRETCVGCQYCAWACPYDAPQFDRASGCMTKCDLCADYLAAGKPPACVAACPMRVLDVHDGLGAAADVAPLPDASLTQPALIITPHAAAYRAGVLGNAEEVSAPRGGENSLVAFTLLAQFAVGATWFTTMFSSANVPINTRALAPVLIVMLVGLLASLLHLGQPRNAWRALANLRTSWLSREVLSAGVFTVALCAMLATGGRGVWLANGAGVALIISMARVYTLRTVPEWNARTTIASFFATTLLLGALWHGALVGAGLPLMLAAAALVGLRMLIGRRDQRSIQIARIAVIVSLGATTFASIGWWVALVVACIAELIARLVFYATRAPRSAWRFAAGGVSATRVSVRA